MSDATALGHPVFDADNHYYEAEDAFTRHLDPTLGSRVIEWCEINGRRYHVIGGRVSRAVTNPTFDPVAMPGAMYDYFRGNPDNRNPMEFLSRREAIRPAYRDPVARVGDARRAGARRLPALPHPRHDLRGAAGPRPRGRVSPVPGVQPLAGRGLGCQLRGPDLRRPVHHAGRSGLRCRRAAPGRSSTGPARSSCARPPRPRRSAAARPSTRCSTASGSWPTTPASPSWSTPPTAASPPTATPSTGSPPRSAAGGGHRSSPSPSSRPSGTISCRSSSRTCSRGSRTCAWPRSRTAPSSCPISSPRSGRRRTRCRDTGRTTRSPPSGDHVWINPFWEDDVHVVVDCMGADRVIFGSDWPHIEALPEPIDYVRELKEFDAVDRRQILFDNVQELLVLRPTSSSAPPGSVAPAAPPRVVGTLAVVGGRVAGVADVLLPRGVAPATADEAAGHDDDQDNGHDCPDDHGFPFRPGSPGCCRRVAEVGPPGLCWTVPAAGDRRAVRAVTWRTPNVRPGFAQP